MRFMLFMIPNIDEKDWMPDPEAVAAMTAYNAELTNAGVLLSLDGLHATSKGARITGAGGKVTVTDGPFTEAKEIIGGYWLIDVASKDEAIEWARRCPAIQGPATVPDYTGPAPVIEIRQVFEMSDFPEEVRRAAEQD
ncbi:MAG: YciI family protein [Acidimicrobiales bacterium]|jgi:hypothetical protein